MIANYHTHTPRCNHAVGQEEQYVQAAIGAGLKILGFSDHTPYLFQDGYVSRIRMLPEELTDYAETVRALQKKYSDRLEIHLGVEAEYYPDGFEKTVQLLRGAGVEYMILGQHWLKNENGQPYCGRESASEEFLEAYCNQSIEALSTGLFTYFAHPDLFCFTGEDEIYRKHMRRICEASLKYDVPLEMNILGFTTGRHYPNAKFWELAGQMGCSAVLGCDAHRPEGLWEPEAEKRLLAMAESCGVKVLETVTLRNL